MFWCCILILNETRYFSRIQPLTFVLYHIDTAFVFLLKHSFVIGRFFWAILPCKVVFPPQLPHVFSSGAEEALWLLDDCNPQLPHRFVTSIRWFCELGLLLDCFEMFWLHLLSMYEISLPSWSDFPDTRPFVYCFFCQFVSRFLRLMASSTHCAGSNVSFSSSFSCSLSLA